MSAQEIHSAPSAPAAPESASSDSPAQPSSEQRAAATMINDAMRTVLNRVTGIAERHGWQPKAMRLSDFLEQQLAELDRYRVADVERDARERENALAAARCNNAKG